MADDERKTYPVMPVKAWWTLRKQFVRSIPAEVTQGYVAATLGITAHSARVNILPTLKVTGIVNEAGVPQDRARRWRDDTKYAAVCKEILAEVYPEELRQLAPDLNTDRQTIKSWFANRSGVGEGGAGKQTAFYSLLLEGDPAKGKEAGTPGHAAAKNAARPARVRKNAKAPQVSPGQGGGVSSAAKQEKMDEADTPKYKSRPELHVNVQIHLSPEATAEQIDQLFQSMAKHLKDM